MKNAQSTQVYVIVGVIFFFGIVLGFKLVYDFIETSSDIRLMEFQSRLKADVSTISSKAGSVEKNSYTLPYQTDRVCFYDSAATGFLPNLQEVKSMIEEGKNVFLLGSKFRSIRIERVRSPEAFYCINATRNTLQITLKGEGNYAMVSAS
ncbi:MAG: hypothetical protein ABIF10_06465 [Candidatus Woesearchaeota archaeon]